MFMAGARAPTSSDGKRREKPLKKSSNSRLKSRNGSTDDGLDHKLGSRMISLHLDQLSKGAPFDGKHGVSIHFRKMIYIKSDRVPERKKTAPRDLRGGADEEAPGLREGCKTESNSLRSRK
jgi:hypothetical protein